MRSRLATLALLGLAAAGPMPAAAQSVLTTSAALACLTPPAGERGLPEYPRDQLDRKDSGTVKAELLFTAPDKAPVFRHLGPYVGRAFEDAVQRHVQAWRVPCMPADGEPVRLLLDFVFNPSDGRRVAGSPPVDAADLQRRLQLRCLTRIEPGQQPEYPDAARRRDAQGNFLIRLRFESPTQPPKATFVAEARDHALKSALEDWVNGYRLPCMGATPIETEMVFAFRLDGGERTRIRDLTLRQFVSSVRNLPRPAYFDFQAMGCPFDLRVSYRQPFSRNGVFELEKSLPERQPFLDWLSQLALRLPEKTQLEVLGDTFTLSVPCGKLDI
jgi:hypothetical protein